MMRVVALKAEFSGLYEWGVGWLSEEKNKAWDAWFENLTSNMHPSHWEYFVRDHGGLASQNLVCINGCVFLHPMGITCVLHPTIITKKNVDGSWIDVVPEIDELKEILKGAAKACGGDVKFSEVVDCYIDDPKFVVDTVE